MLNQMLLLTVFVWGNAFLMLAALYNDKKLNRHIIKNAWGFVIYLVTWVPVGIAGILAKDDKEWFHTPHSGEKD